MSHELLEILAWRLYTHAKDDELLRPVTRLQQIKELEQEVNLFVGIVDPKMLSFIPCTSAPHHTLNLHHVGRDRMTV